MLTEKLGSIIELKLFRGVERHMDLSRHISPTRQLGITASVLAVSSCATVSLWEQHRHSKVCGLAMPYLRTRYPVWTRPFVMHNQLACSGASVLAGSCPINHGQATQSTAFIGQQAEPTDLVIRWWYNHQGSRCVSVLPQTPTPILP